MGSEYGVTEKGFVLKRFDTIINEVQADQSEGFGFDVGQNPQSFLNVLNTTFVNQMAELWEEAQNSYYAKYPSTSEGLNLDNAVQYGGIRRQKNKKTIYSLHCSGDDGTLIRQGTLVASNTMPKVRFLADVEFEITREAFNRAKIRVAANESGIYSIAINGIQYSYISSSGEDDLTILQGLAESIQSEDYKVSVDEEKVLLVIEDKTAVRSNTLTLTENLTTEEVTTIARFSTENYGKLVFPNKTITEIITSINGFVSVENLLEPTYGRLGETDVELRHSYIAKSAIRSTRMIESITSQLINNVSNVESAAGYSNDSSEVDEEGRLPHSIELIVEGGNEMEIAEIILDKKTAGIQMNGSVRVEVPGENGDVIPIYFNRPQYIYSWIKVVLYGNQRLILANYASLTVDAITDFGNSLVSGDSLISQLLHESIYDAVSGITFIDIKIASSADGSFVPEDADYNHVNITVSQRQKIKIEKSRIEVIFDAGNS